MPDDSLPTPSSSENRAGVESAPCALVLQAANRYGPWTVRSLRRAGYRVVVADERSGLAGRSRHCWRRHRLPSPKERPDDFLEALLALCRREAVDVVLAAEDERVNRLLAHHRDTLAPVLFAGPDAAQYDALCDKSRLPEVAAGVGVDHPEWVAVSSPEEDAAWPTLPSVVKPLASEIASWELKAVLVNTPAERERAVAVALAHTREVIVQERVVGRQWRVHFAHDGATFVWVPVATVRTYPAFVGVSTVSTVGGACPTGLGEAARRLIDVVGYRGVGTVQFLQAGGRLLVHDVNLRLPAAVGASIAGGLDLPRLAFEIAMGLPIAPVEPRRATYLWLDGEVRALVAGLRGGAVEASVRRRLGDLARCAMRRGDVVDPLSLRDPLLLLSVAERTVRRALRPAAPV